MQRISTDDLRYMMDMEPGGFLLINVLDPRYFQFERIPGSINVPLSDEDFVARVRAHVKSPHDRVVVYCTNEKSMDSRRAAERLEEAGFKRVFDYEPGMEGWARANLPVETFRPRRTA